MTAISYNNNLLLISFFVFSAAAISLGTTAIPEPARSQNFHPQQELITNVINTLAGNGDFGQWAKILSSPANDNLTSSSLLPLNATIFVPSDASLSHFPTTPPLSFDPFIVPYHIVPQRLFFSDLLRCEIDARIPTLLPNNSILVTSNSASNFTLDDSRITHPDLYVIEGAVVHGIARILDYAVYGSSAPGSLSRDPSSPPPPEPSSPPPPEPWSPPDAALLPQMDLYEFGKSEVSCLCIKPSAQIIPAAAWFVLVLMF